VLIWLFNLVWFSLFEKPRLLIWLLSLVCDEYEKKGKEGKEEKVKM
jgi:hypothetical protein